MDQLLKCHPIHSPLLSVVDYSEIYNVIANDHMALNKLCSYILFTFRSNGILHDSLLRLSREAI